ncbi:F0F1 ATP synthase subunit B [Sinomicrobium weinanense]|uniref:ATP synthase subunit b n=1 Tax=Sinomicrobium weinanense TaxID=2842200 RepID=A0A926JSW8_9FLAO|nr:F0F1 ATP synthase subunit B [Sinomicrobium weinanense]MBC9796922.1 F0F1 ATP synthase subunit B [Sinomicrobium weinanense]MBU3124230.1 F0F1 ATP synthase subunit B [Sinomicrobium weinanense]
MNITHPESLLFWTVLVFIILLFLLRKFAWKPILSAVKTRENSINDALAAAEEARKEMQNLKADNERIIKEARAERDTLLKEAREMKEKIIADAKEEAQQQGSKIIAQAKAAIEGEKKAALAELKSQVAGLSVEIAEKVVKQEFSDKDKQLELVENMIGEVGTLN